MPNINTFRSTSQFPYQTCRYFDQDSAQALAKPVFKIVCRYILFTIATLFLLTHSSAHAQGHGCQNDNQELLRGINLLLSRTSIDDIHAVAGWGVNSIRLAINADSSTQEYDNVYNAKDDVSPEFLSKLDKLIEAANKTNIKVILDMHNPPGYAGGMVWLDYKYWTKLEKLWTIIAKRYSGNRTVYGYDLLNEPNLMESAGVTRPIHIKRIFSETWTFPEYWRNSPRDYFALMTKLTSKINNIDPEKKIIIEGVGLGGRAQNFIWMETVSGSNIIYSFHTYYPKEFGDLGKRTNDPLATEYSSSKGKYLLERHVEHVKRFSQNNKVPIFVGEFGLTYYSEGKGAASWLNDWISIFEQNGWSWSYWAYSINLRRPDRALIKEKLQPSDSAERIVTLKKAWSKNWHPDSDCSSKNQ